MKKDRVRKILLNAFSIFKNPKYAIIALASGIVTALIYFVVYGAIKIPSLFVNLRMATLPYIEFINYAFIFLNSIIFGIIISLLIYIRTEKNPIGKGSLFLGFGAGAFGGVLCPMCLGTNLIILGSVVAVPLAWLIPYIRWIQAASLVFLLLGFWLSAKNLYDADCASCKVKPKKKERNDKEKNKE